MVIDAAHKRQPKRHTVRSRLSMIVGAVRREPNEQEKGAFPLPGPFLFLCGRDGIAVASFPRWMDGWMGTMGHGIP